MEKHQGTSFSSDEDSLPSINTKRLHDMAFSSGEDSPQKASRVDAKADPVFIVGKANASPLLTPKTDFNALNRERSTFY